MEKRGGGSILTLTYLGSERVFTNYNVMGVAKAALEVVGALSGGRPRAAEHPRQRDLGRPDQDAGRGRHLRLLEHPAGRIASARRCGATSSSPKSPTPRVFLLEPGVARHHRRSADGRRRLPRRRACRRVGRRSHDQRPATADSTSDSTSARFLDPIRSATPSSASSRGISSTSAGGPQMKHSVAGSWTSCVERSRVDAAARRRSSRASAARVTVWRSSMSPVVRQRAQLRLVTRTRPASARCRTAPMSRCGDASACRSIARSGAMPVPPAMKTKRRSSGAGGKRERSERALDVDQRRRRRASRCGPAAPSAFDADEQLEAAVALARPRAPRRSSTACALACPCAPTMHRLARRRSRNGWPSRSRRTMRARGVAGSTSRMGSVSSTADMLAHGWPLRSRRAARCLRLVRRRGARDRRSACALAAAGGVGRVQRPLRRVVDRRAGARRRRDRARVVLDRADGRESGLGRRAAEVRLERALDYEHARVADRCRIRRRVRSLRRRRLGARSSAPVAAGSRLRRVLSRYIRLSAVASSVS